MKTNENQDSTNHQSARQKPFFGTTPDQAFFSAQKAESTPFFSQSSVIQAKPTTNEAEEPNQTAVQRMPTLASEVNEQGAVLPSPLVPQQPSATTGDRVIQGKSELTAKSKQLSEVSHPNDTGLPDRLKTGIENLSGYSMDDVRVHYQSERPTQLQAHAYTQGTDIHVAPGQEKHLPHEAWHVVQQKQGRVNPTKQLTAFNINDDPKLEQEADVLGNKAIQRAVSGEQQVTLNEPGLIAQPVVQCTTVDMGNNTVLTINKQNNQQDVMAFLTPNNRGVTDLAPVHLTKNVKQKEALAQINQEGFNLAALSKANSQQLNPHLTLTSGFMASALLDSNIPKLLAQATNPGEIYELQNFTQADMAQRKDYANEVVEICCNTAGLKGMSTFDNLMFEYDPDGKGPNFDEVVEFHRAIHGKLQSIPIRSKLINEPPTIQVTFSDMDNQIAAGADAIIGSWRDWVSGAANYQLGKKQEPTRQSFRIKPEKFHDLVKATKILDKLRIRALEIGQYPGLGAVDDQYTNRVFNETFYRENLRYAQENSASIANLDKQEDSDQVFNVLKFSKVKEELRKAGKLEEARNKDFTQIKKLYDEALKINSAAQKNEKQDGEEKLEKKSTYSTGSPERLDSSRNKNDSSELPSQQSTVPLQELQASPSTGGKGQKDKDTVISQSKLERRLNRTQKPEKDKQEVIEKVTKQSRLINNQLVIRFIVLVAILLTIGLIVISS